MPCRGAHRLVALGATQAPLVPGAAKGAQAAVYDKAARGTIFTRQLEIVLTAKRSTFVSEVPLAEQRTAWPMRATQALLMPEAVKSDKPVGSRDRFSALEAWRA